MTALSGVIYLRPAARCVIFSRPGRKDKRGPASRWETGSRMAVVTVLQPEIAFDKILAASESWDGHRTVWLLLLLLQLTN